jgi:hypothetical protein
MTVSGLGLGYHVVRIPDARIQFQHCSAYKCITDSVLAKCEDWQYSCTLGFKSHFKLVVFLGISDVDPSFKLLMNYN